MFIEQPLPPGTERAIQWREAWTALVALLFAFGPMIGGIVAFGLPSEEWPDGQWKWVFALTFLGMPLWIGFWDWRLRRRERCPTCSGRLKAEDRPSVRRNFLLTCDTCAISWDSGVAYREPPPPSSGN
jgi:MFS family permease